MKPQHSAVLFISWMCLLPVSVAHHSHATIDKDDLRTYKGVVVKYGWTMPHVYLKVRAPDDHGDIVEYSIEMEHPPAMKGKGWDRDTFKPGDGIVWYGAHDKDKSRPYTSLIWAERADGTRIGAQENEAQVIVPSRDFTGLWRRNDVGGFKPHYKPPEGWPLNARGREMVDSFDENQNPMVTCGNPGPPKSMIVPYPVHISRPRDDLIVMERELMQERRFVYLDNAPPPGEPTRMGHSIGRFDGDTLVVETTNFIADKWGTHTGIDSSAQKQLVERFSLSEDGLYLMAEITVTDPVYFSEPVSFSHRWKKLADREIIQAPCTMESALLYLEGGRK
ncbi:MAG: DUF6152 family protein [Woeseiaceae bacterium]|nr:DUF6152 family protein [Woeseiaceae bacterium]